MNQKTINILAIKRKDSVNSAKWYGKANTVLLYAVMMLLILFPGMSEVLANTLIVLCIGMLVFSFVQYARFYKKLFADKTQ